MDKERVTITYSEMKPMSHLDIGEFPEDGSSVGRSKSPSLAGSNDDLTSGLLYERPRIQHVSPTVFSTLINIIRQEYMCWDLECVMLCMVLELKLQKIVT
jgi:hypothetical protein